MGDFNLAGLAALGALGQGLATYGHQKKKESDAGEEYYLELSTSKNFKQKIGTKYRKGMTKIDVRRLFEEDDEDEDKKIMNKYERQFLRNVYAGKEDPLEGIDENADIGNDIIKIASTVDRTNVTQELGHLANTRAVKKELNNMLKFIADRGVKNNAELKALMKDPQFTAILDSISKEAGLRMGSIDDPSMIGRALKFFGMGNKIPAFMAPNQYSTLSGLIKAESAKGTPAEAMMEMAIDHKFVSKDFDADNTANIVNFKKRVKTVLSTKLQPASARETGLDKQIGADLQRAPVEETVGPQTPGTEKVGVVDEKQSKKALGKYKMTMMIRRALLEKQKASGQVNQTEQIATA